jgi:hypothetical protein
MLRVPGFIASGRRSPREWLPALILALLLASSAGADVVIKEKSVSEGLGGFGNVTTSRTLIVAGDKSRSEDEATYTGRFKTLAGGGKPHTTVSITRIDKEVIWNLEPEKKQYTELTFAQMREMMQRGLAGGENAAQEAQAKDAQAKDAEMTFTVDVKRTGAQETINGFPTEQVIITCVGKPKTPQKGAENPEIRLVMDEWLTKSAPGAQEQAEFYRRFAEKLGLDPQLSGVSATARQMYGNGMKELAAKMKGLGGVAIRSTFTIEGSPEMAEAQKRSAEERESRQAEAKVDRAKAREQAEADEKKQDQEDAKDLGAAAVTGGSIKGGIGGFLGRKLASAAQKKAEAKVEKKTEEMSGSSPAAGGPLMKVVTEVIGISTSPAPAGSFDVPAGYKLQKQE